MCGGAARIKHSKQEQDEPHTENTGPVGPPLGRPTPWFGRAQGGAISALLSPGPRFVSLLLFPLCSNENPAQNVYE